MSSGTQVDLEWAGASTTRNEASVTHEARGNGASAGRDLTDEEILGLEPIGTENGQRDSSFGRAASTARTPGTTRPRNDSGEEGAAGATDHGSQATGHESRFTNHEAQGSVAMPSWMRAAAADPQHGGEAAQLWREHQEFRGAFASPEEARAVRELLPGGVRDALSLREATQSVERIDAALFSGDPRAQAEVVAELARANPAAFRSLFAEAAKVLAGLGGRGGEAVGTEAGIYDTSTSNGLSAAPTLRENREGWGTRAPGEARNLSGVVMNDSENLQRDSSSPRRAGAPQNDNLVRPAAEPTTHESHITNHLSSAVGELSASDSRVASHESQVTNHESRNFDAGAYAAFERSTNDAVARDVRGAIGDTLARVLPDGVADGAARRIGEDIFQEIHRALAGDRALSEQVAAVLQSRRFGSAEQQRVASLLAGRARQLVPSVARRVIGEWTSSVLNTSRAKAARQATAASRVDIAAPGGSGDSMPLRSRAAGSAREVDYAAMTDEQILGM